MSSCSDNILPPDVKKIPKEMKVHGDIRTDNYYWMRLTDEQKSAKKYDDQTQSVVDYIDEETKYLKNTVGKLIHKLVFPRDELPKVYELINDLTTPKLVVLSQNNAYNVKPGRSFTQNTLDLTPRNCSFKWQHYAPSEVRIDPSISNIIEMFVITKTFYASMLEYKNGVVTAIPEAPTSDELGQELSGLDNFKSLNLYNYKLDLIMR